MAQQSDTPITSLATPSPRPMRKGKQGRGVKAPTGQSRRDLINGCNCCIAKRGSAFRSVNSLVKAAKNQPAVPLPNLPQLFSPTRTAHLEQATNGFLFPKRASTTIKLGSVLKAKGVAPGKRPRGRPSLAATKQRKSISYLRPIQPASATYPLPLLSAPSDKGFATFFSASASQEFVSLSQHPDTLGQPQPALSSNPLLLSFPLIMMLFSPTQRLLKTSTIRQE